MNTNLFITILKYLATFVVGFGIAFLIFHRCNKQPEVLSQTSDTVRVIDTDTIKTTLTKLKIVKETVKIPEYINQTVDTFAILITYGYFNERSYDTVVQSDTSCYERLQLSTWQNNIQFIKRDFINRRPYQTIINSTVTQGCRGKFGFGAGVDYSWDKTQGGISLYAGIEYVSAKHLSISADINPFRKTVMLGAKYLVYKK
jgi:hypothetical protein